MIQAAGPQPLWLEQVQLRTIPRPLAGEGQAAGQGEGTRITREANLSIFTSILSLGLLAMDK